MVISLPVKAHPPLWPNDQTRQGRRSCASAASEARAARLAPASFDNVLATKANFAEMLNKSRHRF
jgi:hypothetical protein